MLLLEDLKDMSLEDVRAHIVRSYKADANRVMDFDVVIGYESVGSWGCDSSSFFLLKDADGKLYETHGSHCSCYGFEGQFQPEETSVEALKFRIENGGTLFSVGGYDSGGWDRDTNPNLRAAKDYVLNM
jgi:hypothetical protein